MANPELKPTPELGNEQPQPTAEELRARIAEAQRLLDEQIRISTETLPKQEIVPEAVAIHDEALPDFGEDEPAVHPEDAVQNLSAVVSGDPKQAKTIIDHSQDPLDTKLGSPDLTPGDVAGEDPSAILGKFYGTPDR